VMLVVLPFQVAVLLPFSSLPSVSPSGGKDRAEMGGKPLTTGWKT